VQELEPSIGGRWWTSSRLRLSALLLLLGLCVLVLLESNGPLSAPSSGRATDHASTRACALPAAPPLRSVDLDAVVGLHDQLLPVMAPLARLRYASGIAQPDVVWSDEPPQRFASARMTGDLWPAGFEMRVWARDPENPGRYADVVGDVFEFAGAKQAADFFAVAVGLRCHAHAQGSASSRPPGARTLTWRNPDRAIQDDVFLLRGPRVYRLAAAKIQRRSPQVERRTAIDWLERLACGLPQAGCRVSR
jgi:hypothetical protein